LRAAFGPQFPFPDAGEGRARKLLATPSPWFYWHVALRYVADQTRPDNWMNFKERLRQQRQKYTMGTLGCDSVGAIMVDFAYTTVPGKIKQILNKIRHVGIPQKASVTWLKSIGFTSSNDTSLIGVLKFVEFLDNNGVPTPNWSQFRGNSHKKVLGDAIRNGYSSLFAVYPDANSRPQPEIEHVFKTSSSAGNQVIAKTVATFKALVEEAEFLESNNESEFKLPTTPLHLPIAEVPKAQTGEPKSLSGASLHIDIQIHISPESSAEQIDQIFGSMAKHLYHAKK
jgi:hypothetical protein